MTTELTFTVHQLSVGTVAQQLPFYKSRRVLIKSDDSNTGNVYVGTTGVDASSGFKLIGSDGIEVNTSRSDEVWVYADTASQLVYYLIEFERSV